AARRRSRHGDIAPVLPGARHYRPGRRRGHRPGVADVAGQPGTGAGGWVIRRSGWPTSTGGRSPSSSTSACGRPGHRPIPGRDDVGEGPSTIHRLGGGAHYGQEFWFFGL
ncbi:MAG: hypothetical protein AVDCRST_MAG10-286, partial [uncultured Acidimicrobiales bacterium]